MTRLLVSTKGGRVIYNRYRLLYFFVKTAYTAESCVTSLAMLSNIKSMARYRRIVAIGKEAIEKKANYTFLFFQKCSITRGISNILLKQ